MTTGSCVPLGRRAVASVVVAALVAALPACSSGSAVEPTSPQPAEVELPEQILGLAVVQEDLTKDISEVRSSTYLSSVALFSMREGDLFQASLQVSRLTELAKPESEAFRRQVAGLMGGSGFEELQVGPMKVYMSSGKQQVLYAWFKGKSYSVLTVRRAYPFRRSLLRKVLALEEPR